MRRWTLQVATMALLLGLTHCDEDDSRSGATGTATGTGAGTGTGTASGTATGDGSVPGGLCAASLVTKCLPCQDGGTEGAGGAAHNCRFWGIISLGTPTGIIEEHLLNLPDAIKQLGADNDDGWGIGYYADGADEPTVHRGQQSAASDSSFDDAARETGSSTPRIAVSHVRQCLSGLCDIPNPHPFQRELLGRHWLMGHNGTIDKDLLIALLDPDFLDAHPPQTGSGPSDWLASELYFLFLLQNIEALSGDVATSVASVAQQIHDGSTSRPTLNFFLTDGETLWAYREGETLSYVYDPADTSCSAIASQPPIGTTGLWLPLSERVLATFHQQGEPSLLTIPY